MTQSSCGSTPSRTTAPRGHCTISSVVPRPSRSQTRRGNLHCVRNRRRTRTLGRTTAACVRACVVQVADRRRRQLKQRCAGHHPVGGSRIPGPSRSVGRPHQGRGGRPVLAAQPRLRDQLRQERAAAGVDGVHASGAGESTLSGGMPRVGT